MNRKSEIDYYEHTDFSDLIKKGKGAVKGTTKRITMNISDTIYEEANELDSYMQMGYQNVLKTAMTIGITELYNQVSKHNVNATKKAGRTPSRRSRSARLVQKNKKHLAPKRKS